jgi:hypothetical protein
VGYRWACISSTADLPQGPDGAIETVDRNIARLVYPRPLVQAKQRDPDMRQPLGSQCRRLPDGAPVESGD